MKTKNLFRFGFLMVAMMTIIFAGCSKKDNTTTKDKANTESMQQLTNDENNVENASDQALNDVDMALSPGTLKSTQWEPCGGTITFSGVVNDTITIDISYNGLNCNNTVYRTGDVIIKHRYQQPWGQAGAAVIVTLNNFKLTKVANNKSLTLNGRKLYENVSGHYLWELGLDSTVTSVVHRVSGTVNATFDNLDTKMWNIARQRAFSGNLLHLVMTTDGFGTADGYTNLATWGINRNGEQFYSSITQSVVHKQDCDWNPCSGIIKHEIPSASKSATVTFGYDSNNNLITNGDCPTRYRIDWVIGNLSGTFFLPL